MKPGAKKKPTALQPHELLMSPSVNAALRMERWVGFNDQKLDIPNLVADLRERINAVKAGDMSSAEAMLIGQATSLDVIFTSLICRASRAQQMSQMQAYLNMALRAQAQARATLQALSEVKHPRTATFVRQTNVAAQQVVQNGGLAHETPPNRPNELLEAHHVDTLPQGAAGGRHPRLAAVDKGHRADHA